MPVTAFDRAVVPASVYFTLHRNREGYVIHCLICNKSWQCPEFPYASGYYEPLKLHLFDHNINVYKLLSFAVAEHKS